MANIVIDTLEKRRMQVQESIEQLSKAYDEKKKELKRAEDVLSSEQDNYDLLSQAIERETNLHFSVLHHPK